MSTRQMGERYRASSGGGHTNYPDVDLFGLKEKRYKRQLDAAAEAEKSVEAARAAEERSKIRLEDELKRNRENVETLKTRATELGLTLDQYLNNITQGNITLGKEDQKNKQKIIEMQGKSLGAAGSQEASDIGTRFKLAGLPPDVLFGNTPSGSMGTKANVPGLNAPIGAPIGAPQIHYGGGTAETAFPYGGIRNPDTGEMMGEKVAEIKTPVPGRVSMPQGSFTPADVNAMRGGASIGGGALTNGLSALPPGMGGATNFPAGPPGLLPPAPPLGGPLAPAPSEDAVAKAALARQKLRESRAMAPPPVAAPTSTLDRRITSVPEDYKSGDELTRLQMLLQMFGGQGAR